MFVILHISGAGALSRSHIILAAVMAVAPILKSEALFAVAPNLCPHCTHMHENLVARFCRIGLDQLQTFELVRVALIHFQSLPSREQAAVCGKGTSLVL